MSNVQNLVIQWLNILFTQTLLHPRLDPQIPTVVWQSRAPKAGFIRNGCGRGCCRSRSFLENVWWTVFIVFLCFCIECCVQLGKEDVGKMHCFMLNCFKSCVYLGVVTLIVTNLGAPTCKSAFLHPDTDASKRQALYLWLQWETSM